MAEDLRKRNLRNANQLQGMGLYELSRSQEGAYSEYDQVRYLSARNFTLGNLNLKTHRAAVKATTGEICRCDRCKQAVQSMVKTAQVGRLGTEVDQSTGDDKKGDDSPPPDYWGFDREGQMPPLQKGD